MTKERIRHHVIWVREDVGSPKSDPRVTLAGNIHLLPMDQQLVLVSSMDRLETGRVLSERVRVGEIGLDYFGVDIHAYHQDPSSQQDLLRDIIHGEYDLHGDALALMLANDLSLSYPEIASLLQGVGFDATVVQRYNAPWLLVGRYPIEFSNWVGYDKALIGDAENI